jgi:hypothetical protein
MNFQESKYDGILVFVCFFGGAIAGYLLVNHTAIFGF